MNPLQTPVARYVWRTRYASKTDGVVQEASIEDSWRRVARAVASVETENRDGWETRFYRLMQGFNFLPGGRILANAGTGPDKTLFNCFVMGLIRDDPKSIRDALEQAALTMRAGGGAGFDFTTLYPRGFTLPSGAGSAEGPVSHLQQWDRMCASILSGDSRRGAMLASLRCDHPDIESFVNAKREAGQLRHFNLSVQVSDELMRAVEDDSDWPLLFPLQSDKPVSKGECKPGDWPGFDAPVPCRVIRRLPARALWRQIMQAAYDSAEPGVLFTDRINEFNNLSYRERLTTTNPCGEIPLPAHGACNLGSINLTRFVLEPFTSHARIDFEALQATTALATRLLDNVIDCSGFPLEAQARQARGSRRIGLGITGLADALIMLELRYDREEARQLATQAMQTICHSAYRASIELAREKGSFAFFDPDAFLESPFIQSLPQDIRVDIQRHGIRNSHLTAIAPTGAISLLADNLSSGIEPVFDLRQTRRILNTQGDYETFQLEDYAFFSFCQLNPSFSALPPSFISARELEPRDHLLMQAALQPYVDSAISKTINVPRDYPFEDFYGLYREAWKLGLKGCTAFRVRPAGETILDAPARCCETEPAPS